MTFSSTPKLISLYPSLSFSFSLSLARSLSFSLPRPLAHLLSRALSHFRAHSLSICTFVHAPLPLIIYACTISFSPALCRQLGERGRWGCVREKRELYYKQAKLHRIQLCRYLSNHTPMISGPIYGKRQRSVGHICGKRLIEIVLCTVSLRSSATNYRPHLRKEMSKYRAHMRKETFRDRIVWDFFQPWATNYRPSLRKEISNSRAHARKQTSEGRIV